MIERHSIETAYSFFHQKQRVYQYSTLDWQRDDIEYAIGSYVDQMNPELYDLLSQGDPRFLRDHQTFASDIERAIQQMEGFLDLNN